MAVGEHQRAAIEGILNTEIVNISSLHGGMIGDVYHIKLANQSTVVAKVAADSTQNLETEAYMLRYLAEHTALPVPEVLHSDAQMLLMTHLSGNSHFSPAAQRHAAELLAALHDISASAFGMERDTIIATLAQPNPWTSSWIDFFREQRLLHLGRHAVRIQHMPASLLRRLEKLAAALERWLEEPEQPSLIHGDIWATNVLATESQVTGFLDPAIYYGHAEVELAYITLFNTFSQPFFERYHELRPISPGFFEVRRDLYNLYPLLVHVCEFGGGYVNSVESILNRYGF
ncbi:MAG: fructosamine kinase family protein [Anaerolineae bacterium]|nr:fructosamine kinase family protein [Anaerolineae bacterium]